VAAQRRAKHPSSGLKKRRGEINKIKILKTSIFLNCSPVQPFLKQKSRGINMLYPLRLEHGSMR
jgi:hypothetical protein